MARPTFNHDIWIFQNREGVREPFAAKVHGIRKGHACRYVATVFAEWLPAGQFRTEGAFEIVRFGLSDTGAATVPICPLAGIIFELSRACGGDVGTRDMQEVSNSMRNLYHVMTS